MGRPQSRSRRQPQNDPGPSPDRAPSDRSGDSAANDDDPPQLRRCLEFLDRLFGEPVDDGHRD